MARSSGARSRVTTSHSREPGRSAYPRSPSSRSRRADPSRLHRFCGPIRKAPGDSEQHKRAAISQRNGFPQDSFPYQRAQGSANHHLHPLARSSSNSAVRLPGSHKLVTPVTSTSRSISLSGVSSPRAAEPNRRIFSAPWRAATRRTSSRRAWIAPAVFICSDCIDLNLPR